MRRLREKERCVKLPPPLRQPWPQHGPAKTTPRSFHLGLHCGLVPPLQHAGQLEFPLARTQEARGHESDNGACS